MHDHFLAYQNMILISYTYLAEDLRAKIYTTNEIFRTAVFSTTSRTDFLYISGTDPEIFCGGWLSGWLSGWLHVFHYTELWGVGVAGKH